MASTMPLGGRANADTKEEVLVEEVLLGEVLEGVQGHSLPQGNLLPPLLVLLHLLVANDSKTMKMPTE